VTDLVDANVLSEPTKVIVSVKQRLDRTQSLQQELA